MIGFYRQNDIWQTQSWASLEWSGQWKLLHYFMRRTYDYILVSPYYISGSVCVYVVVDVANYDVTYDLKVDVVSWASVSPAALQVLPYIIIVTCACRVRL